MQVADFIDSLYPAIGFWRRESDNIIYEKYTSLKSLELLHQIWSVTLPSASGQRICG
jgi:hypothetical protein